MENKSRRSRPRDLNQLAKHVTEIATGEIPDNRTLTQDGRDLGAVLLGRLGGLKGGVARATALTPERRREIARTAASARWNKNDG